MGVSILVHSPRAVRGIERWQWTIKMSAIVMSEK